MDGDGLTSTLCPHFRIYLEPLLLPTIFIGLFFPTLVLVDLKEREDMDSQSVNREVQMLSILVFSFLITQKK